MNGFNSTDSGNGLLRNRENGGRAGFEKREKRRKIRQLQSAISDGDVSRVREILSSNFDVDFQYNSQTSLQLAVCEGKEEICALLIAKGANIEQCDAQGNSLLNMACWRGFFKVAQLLVQAGADLDSQNESGNTCLHVCVMKQMGDLCNLLLSSGCSVNVNNNNGLTPLHNACQSGHMDLLQQLLSAKADPNWVDLSGRTPLHLAAKGGRVNVVKALINAGCNIDLRSRHGTTALYEAASAGHLDVVKELISHRANLDCCTVKGSTPLLEAISNKNTEIAKTFIDSGCNVNLADRTHEAPIHILIRQISSLFSPSPECERLHLVHCLVEAGADVNKKDCEGSTALYLAAAGGDLDLCRYLLSHGGSISEATSKGNTILHAAVFSGNTDIVKLCLSAGSDVNYINKSGQHSLLAAVTSRCNFEILTLLVEAGSNVNIVQKQDNHTALHEAVCQHYEAAVRLLIENGSSLSAVNKEMQTPLYLACQRGLTDTVSYMVQCKDCPLSSEFPSALPIHAAAIHGRSECVTVLAKHGCDLNQLNEKGMTPVMAALDEDSFSSVRALLQAGCDLEYQQKLRGLQICCLKQDDEHPHIGLEPLFLAMTHKNMDLMKMLLDCYRQLPRRTIHLTRMLLQKTAGLRSHFTQAQKQEIYKLYANSLSRPLTLMDSCRRIVRSCLGSPLEEKVQQLPVADKVKRFVLMEEEFSKWMEKEQEMPGGSSGFSHIFIKKSW